MALKPKAIVEDRLFIDQIRAIESFTSNLANAVIKPQLTVIHISLSKLIIAHPEGSPAYVEATKILRTVSKHLSEVVSRVYEYEAVFAIVESKEDILIRSRRAVSANGDEIVSAIKSSF